jgi:serine/threonine protein kinase
VIKTETSPTVVRAPLKHVPCASASASQDDPRVIAALERYLALWEQGPPPDRDAFLADHPDIAAVLGPCLEGLALVQAAAPGVSGDIPAAPGFQLPLPPGEGRERGSEVDAHLPNTLGDFRILREIGRGGMGVVYEAEQLSLSRRVALKVLPFASMLDPRHLQRFKNEALAAAHLDHPNIVEVYGTGCERGVHFYAMRYVEGQTLAAVIEALKLAPGSAGGRAGFGVQDGNDAASVGNALRGVPVVECDDSSSLSFSNDVARQPGADGTQARSENQSCDRSQHSKDTVPAALSTLRTERPKDFYRLVAELGIQAAEALDHAHNLGIVHRDIKPSNLMIECRHVADSTPLSLRREAGRGVKECLITDHRPLTTHLFITDFGLAHIESDATLTLTGDLLGTLRYMSPEQAEGRTAVLDHRTDIYSLGITLYELAILRPAFPATDRQTLLKQIAHDEPIAPRKLNPSVPVELETIITKSVAKEPGDRYTSAGELAADLRRLLANEPIRARSPTRLARARKWSYRHRAVVATAVTTLILALSASTFLIARAYSNERQERTRAEAAQRRAESSLAFARGAVDDMYLEVATVWLGDDRVPSRIQQGLLRRALQVYESLAAEPITDSASRSAAAVAYERIGEIRKYLGDDRQAAEALEIAIDLEKENVASSGESIEMLLALATRYRKLSLVQDALAKWSEADDSHRAGMRYASALVKLAPEQVDYRYELALHQIQAAQLASRAGRYADAEKSARQASDDLRDLVGKEYNRLDWFVARTKADLLVADLLRRRGRLDEAHELDTKVLKQVHGRQRFAFHDSRELALLEAQASEQLADVAFDRGELLRAAELLRETLALKQQLLRAKRRPAVFLAALFTEHQRVKMHEGEETVPFCSFAQTQLQLALVLRSLGRPYEAEQLLGEAMITVGMMGDLENTNARQIMLLYGKVYEAAADLLSSERPHEADAMRQSADCVWRAVAAYFPKVVELPDLPPSIRQRLKSHVRSAAAKPAYDAIRRYRSLQDSRSDKRPLPKTSFDRHAYALAWYHAENWNEAIKAFEESAALREADPAYDWLYLAMANHRHGNQAEAQKWFDKANDAIHSAEKPHAELIELRDQANRLIQTPAPEKPS